jgi:hypothetical protein
LECWGFIKVAERPILPRTFAEGWAPAPRSMRIRRPPIVVAVVFAIVVVGAAVTLAVQPLPSNPIPSIAGFYFAGTDNSSSFAPFFAT